MNTSTKSKNQKIGIIEFIYAMKIHIIQHLMRVGQLKDLTVIDIILLKMRIMLSRKMKIKQK